MEEKYYDQIRYDILELIPNYKNQNILEIGCGNGSTLGYLKRKGYAKITVGIESNLDCKKKSFKNDIDHFISEDVENLEFKLKIKFNLILILDVFEHLIHPWKVFNQFSNHLEKDGLFIVSIPNIRNLKVINNLIFNGTWDYEESGIMDRTHLRYFTDKSFKKQLNNQNLNYSIINSKRNYDHMSLKKKWLKNFKLFEDFVTCQFLYLIQINEN